MALVATTKDELLEMGDILPSEKKELAKILDIGGGSKTTWYYEEGKYDWPKSSANTIKADGLSIGNIKKKVKLQNIFSGDEKAKVTVVYKIGRQKVKFMQTGGAKSGVSDSLMTEIQELGSAKVFEYAIKKNKAAYKTVDDMIKDKDLMSDLLDIYKGKSKGKLTEVDEQWLESFFKQQQVLIKKIQTPNFTDFQRDGGFMDFIKNTLQDFGISKKDTSNPSDIWLIQDEQKVIGKIK